MKKSSVNVQSTKRTDRKAKLQEKGRCEKDVAQALQQYNDESHMRGETLPIEQQVYRVKVVQKFLRAVVPLNKIQLFRGLLEENAYRLTDRLYLTDLVPFILKKEQQLIKREIAGRNVEVIFDGTTCLGVGLAIVV